MSERFLVGKTALVTGSTSGIGLGLARALAKEGANVVLNGFGPHEQAVAEVAAWGVETAFHGADMRKASEIEAMMQFAAERFGRVDVLVNNAGLGHVGTILTTEPTDLERLWQVNVLGAYFLSRAVLPSMSARSNGSIINLGSVAALIGMESRFAYTVSKHAIMGMTRAMALDHGPAGVRINCICPGRTQTPFVEQRLREYPDPEVFMNQMVAPHALKRLAQPWEIAAAALYLASDASANVTGSALSVDGGYTAGK